MPAVFHSRLRLKIGLVGGSFNPAHDGHIHVALKARQQLGLDQIWWLVSPQNPLKSSLGMASHEKRLADARKLVDAMFAGIGEAAAKGGEISFNGFGKFKVKDSPAREGRNPTTGEAMTIKASRKLGFSAAKALKDKLNP